MVGAGGADGPAARGGRRRALRDLRNREVPSPGRQAIAPTRRPRPGGPPRSGAAGTRDAAPAFDGPNPLAPPGTMPDDPTALDTANPFADLGLDRPLVDALAALGYEEPTPIQRAAIPILLGGRDLLGQAATGTGNGSPVTRS